MEKTCKKCGKTLPLEMFPKDKGYYRNTCKTCTNKAKIEWKKKKGRSEEDRTKDTLRCGLNRERLKAETGKTYRNKKDAEYKKAYARKYEAEHKDDQKYIETRRRCQRNAFQRKKIREEVEILSEFFSNDFEF